MSKIKSHKEYVKGQLIAAGIPPSEAEKLAEKSISCNKKAKLGGITDALDYLSINIDKVKEETEELGFHRTSEQEELLDCLHDVIRLWRAMRHG